VLVLCIEVLLCWVLRHLQLSCLPLGLIPCSLCSVLPYLLLLLSRFSRVRLCATPRMAAHQAPPSLGFFFILGLFCLIWGLLLQLSFASHFHGIYFSILSISVYTYLQVWSGFLIYGPCLCICSASLCLLVGVFNPSTFKVVIDIYVPIAIFLIVWGWFFRYFFFCCLSWLYTSL